MIVESIHLSHVGPFIEPVSVGPLDPGLNILAASNESGKSTLIKAATRGLFDRHTCKDSEIRALQPVGTDLSPKIAVVFRAGGGKFRIEKTFWNAPKCQLSEWIDQTWRLVAEGDAADTRMQALLKSKPPAKGATRAAHWGLFRYLWARQDEPAAWPEWEGDAGTHVQSRLAKIEVDPLIERLRAALWSDYLESFTPTGQIKAGGPLKKAEDELALIDQELLEIQTKRRELESLQNDYRKLAGTLGALEREAADRHKEAADIREAAGKAEIVSIELRARENEFAAAQTRLTQTKADVERFDRDKESLVVIRNSLEQRERLSAEQAKLGSTLQQQLNEAETKAEEQGNKSTGIQSTLTRLRDLLRYKRLVQECDRLEALWKRIEKKANEHRDLAGQRSRLPDVTSKQLKAWETLQQKIREKEIRQESVGLTVEAEPLSKAEIEWMENGEKRTASIEPRTSKTIRQPQSVELELIGWGTLRVRSGASEAKDLLAEIEADGVKLMEGLRESGIQTLDEARSAASRRQDLESQIQAAAETLKQLLGDWQSEDRLAQELAAKRVRIDSLAKTLQVTEAETGQTLADLEAQEQMQEVDLNQQSETTKRLAQDMRRLRGELNKVRDERLEIENKIAALRAELQSTQARLEVLSARYPQGIQQALAAAQSEFVAAEARLDDARRKLPADFEKLPERNRRAAAASQQVASDLDRRRNDLAQLEGNLKARGSEGLYSKETALIERREMVLQSVQAARLQGESARLVHMLIENRRHEATRSVLAPLEARLSSAFAEITGEESRKVFLDQNLQIRGIGRNEEQTISFDALSQGAKEQLILALRMAVAVELSSDEPQLLVLDDVLVNTDSARQQRILDILQNSARSLQVLILTCHPERYRGVGRLVSIQQAA